MTAICIYKSPTLILMGEDYGVEVCLNLPRSLHMQFTHFCPGPWREKILLIFERAHAINTAEICAFPGVY